MRYMRFSFFIYSLPTQLESKLVDLLEVFKDIFKEPIELSPTGDIDHQIVLKPVSIPKHQYPYRTSHNHKDEIERIVQELLDVGLIQQRKRPFASPIIW